MPGSPLGDISKFKMKGSGGESVQVKSNGKVKVKVPMTALTVGEWMSAEWSLMIKTPEERL